MEDVGAPLATQASAVAHAEPLIEDVPSFTMELYGIVTAFAIIGQLPGMSF